MINKAKKAVIHIAKVQVGMTEQEYRDLLGSVGVASSADPEMTDGKFRHIMRQMEKMGYQTKSKARKKRNVRNAPKSKKALLKKLDAILSDMGLPWSYVDSMAKSRFGKDAANWLDGDDLYKLVQMMVIHQKRRQKKCST